MSPYIDKTADEIERLKAALEAIEFNCAAARDGHFPQDSAIRVIHNIAITALKEE
jgi:hypothetical protein